MASITARKTKNSTVYDIQICLTKTDRRKLYAFINRRIAERFGEKLEDLLSSRLTGIPNREVQEWLLALAQTDPQRYDKLVAWGLAEPRKTNGTLQALTAKYLDDPDVKETTLGARKVTCKRLLRFFRPDRQVSTITYDDANQFYLWLQKNFAVGTYGRDIKRVKQIFKLAVEEGLILRNPFRNFRGSSTTDTSRFHYVSIEDTMKIMDEITDPQLRLAFVLARFGGLRIPSELRFMEWKDIDLTSSKFYVKMPKKTNKHEQAAGNFTTRAVPLFPEVRQAFMDYFESLPEGSPALIFGDVKFNRSAANSSVPWTGRASPRGKSSSKICARPVKQNWRKSTRSRTSRLARQLPRRCSKALFTGEIEQFPTGLRDRNDRSFHRSQERSALRCRNMQKHERK